LSISHQHLIIDVAAAVGGEFDESRPAIKLKRSDWTLFGSRNRIVCDIKATHIPGANPGYNFQ
jgi:hypothetical protein